MHSLIDQLSGDDAGFAVDIEYNVDIGRNCSRPHLEARLEHVGNVDPTDAALEELVDGDLVGGAEPGRGRLSPARPAS